MTPTEYENLVLNTPERLKEIHKKITESEEYVNARKRIMQKLKNSSNTGLTTDEIMEMTRGE